MGSGSGERRSPSVALDILSGLASILFAALLLWTLPGFLGLPADTRGYAAMAVGLVLAYGGVGPHPGRWGLRLGPGVLAGACVAVTVGLAAINPTVGPGSALALWAHGGTAQLSGPDSWLVSAACGAGIGLPLFLAASRRSALIAVAAGLALVTVEWEFVDSAVTVLFWPLAATGLAWVAVSRARAVRMDNVSEDAGRSRPPLLAALAGGAVVLLALYSLPRNGAPANLGAVGRWINRLPVLGTLERSTREGALGAAPVSTSSSGGASGTVSTPGQQNGFDLSQVGFGQSASQLGGPATPGDGVALKVYITPGASLPHTLYLGGSLYDEYTGQGWQRSTLETATDPGWVDQAVGPLAIDFLRGQSPPSPFSTVNIRVSPVGIIGNDIFTLLAPLRETAAAAAAGDWDAAGELWAPNPQTSPYAETAAVIPTSVYSGTGLATYTTPSGTTLTPIQAASYPNAARLHVHRTTTVHDLGGQMLPTDLSVPSELPAAVISRALQWTRAVRGHPLLEALAIQNHLMQYPYTLNAPPPPPGTDFVDFFLFSAKKGYCTYYSSAMAVMLRALGIPTRWVEGFRVPVPAGGGTVDVQDAWAHSWVEAYIAPYGWLTFDPTPAADNPTARTAPAPTGTPPVRGHRTPWWLVLVAVGIAAGATIFTGVLNLLAERRALRDPLRGPQVIWRTCERVGARWGRRRRREETPAEYAEALAASFPPVADAVRAMAVEYGRLSFGPPVPGGTDPETLSRLQSQWEEIQDGWRHLGPVMYPVRRWL